MIDIATHKIGDRWFLEFVESMTPVDVIADIQYRIPDGTACSKDFKTGQLFVIYKNGAYDIRTPVKAEPKSRLEKDIESAELGLAMLGMGSF